MDKKILKAIYEDMILSREIDEAAKDIPRKIGWGIHLGSAGQEAETAVAYALNKEIDWISPYYRNIPLVTAWGVSPEDTLRGFFGKATDPFTGGRQMPQHWGSKNLCILPTSSVVGGHLMRAVGAAYYFKYKKERNVVLVSFGDGATSQGDFHEAMNWAAIFELPVIFLCINNNWALSVPIAEQMASPKISSKAFPYNMPCWTVSGFNIEEVFNVAEEAVFMAREYGQPSLIELLAPRLRPHSFSDDDVYRIKGEIKQLWKNDPLLKIEEDLIKDCILTLEEAKLIKNKTKERIGNILEQIKKEDDPNPDNILTHIYKTDSDLSVEVLTEPGAERKIKYVQLQFSETKIEMTYSEAINSAMKIMMRQDKNVLTFGEDVGSPKDGVFKVYKDLGKEFGKERVFNTPLGESGIIGAAIGMAAMGMRPVAEIEFGDYIFSGFNHLKNELNLRWRTNNNFCLPLVIRTPVGAVRGGGPYHSQSIEGFLTHIPGIKIAFPSSPFDAKGLLISAIQDENPVIFLEHKLLYHDSALKEKVPVDYYEIPFGQAKCRRQGRDLTIVTYGRCVIQSLESAEIFDAKGISIEIIDLRTLVPLDKEAILESIKKTNKTLVIHEDILFSGFGAELSAFIQEEAFEYLDAPVKRVASKNCFPPYHPNLEKAVIIQTEDIIKAVEELIRY